MSIPKVHTEDNIIISLTNCPKELLSHAIKYWYIHDTGGSVEFNCEKDEKEKIIKKLINRIWKEVNTIPLSIAETKEFIIRLKLAELSLRDIISSKKV
jgi:hypothetical protein